MSVRVVAGLIGCLAALGCAGCGSGAPVARVDGAPISRSTFEHWLKVALASGQQGQPLTLVPPRFEQCVAQLSPRNDLGPILGSATEQAHRRSQCAQRYQSARVQVMTFLIGAAWARAEAKSDGVALSKADVQQTLKREAAGQFSGSGSPLQNLQGFLGHSGMSQDDLLFRVRVDALGAKLRDRAQAGDDTVPQAAVAAYYRSHVKQFDLPERRNISVIATDSQARAVQAAAQVRGGQSFETVGRGLPSTGGHAALGVLRGIQLGHHDPAFDRAVFGAALGQVVGPVRTTRGYYLMRVEKVLPAGQQSLSEATPAIRSILVAAVHGKRLAAFNAQYQIRWRPVTLCARDLMVPACGGTLGSG